MKNKQNGNSSSNDTLVWGLILGFMGGLLMDNLALGLVAGVIVGSLPKCINKGKNKSEQLAKSFFSDRRRNISWIIYGYIF